jgi:hypothetical protein
MTLYDLYTITAVGDPPHWPCDIPLSAKLALTSPTTGARSVGVVRSGTQATELAMICTRLGVSVSAEN